MSQMDAEGGSGRADAPGVEHVPALDDVLVRDAPALSASFEDFYEIEHASLFGALVLITGSRHEAEDVMQDAFLRIWERWDLVQGLANPTGYLYRTALNVFRMRRRRALVAGRHVIRKLRVTKELDEAEARHEVDRGLAAMPPRQRAAVVLTELLEFSSSEAAEALGCKPATVRKLAQQGRDTLRRTLGVTPGDRGTRRSEP
jgi:RNA polymerase sigma-70 factor (ECF subfamily)